MITTIQISWSYVDLIALENDIAIESATRRNIIHKIQ